MTNEEVMQLMTDMGLHEGGMDDWVFDNAWVMFANAVAQRQREKDREQAVALLRQLHDSFSLESAELRIGKWAAKERA